MDMSKTKSAIFIGKSTSIGKRVILKVYWNGRDEIGKKKKKTLVWNQNITKRSWTKIEFPPPIF